jgi:ABC-type antimicrobial peptide transport system permease subunit
MSFSTRQRSREFGVRVALGAQPSDILRMVVREGVTLALAGVAAGVVAALALTRLIRGLLFGISASDPLTYVAAAAGILALSAAACYLPARRAVRSDPLVTLKAS